MRILLQQIWIVLILSPVTELTIVTDTFTMLDTQNMTGKVGAELMVRSKVECALR